MPQGQSRRPGPVAGSLREPATKAGAVTVAHPGAGQVAHSPARLVQSQAKVDILADPQFRAESATDCCPADHQGRAWDVGQRGQWDDRSLASAHIQRRPHVLVPVEPAGLGRGQADHPGRGQRQGGIAELGQQRAQPARFRPHVGVAESDVPGPGVAKPGVTGRRGSLVVRMSEKGGAVPAGHRGHGGGVDGTVVNHQHRKGRCLRVGAQRGQQPVQQVRPVPDRDHDREVTNGPRIRARERYADIHQPPGQGGRRRIRHGEPAWPEQPGRRREPQQPGGEPPSISLPSRERCTSPAISTVKPFGSVVSSGPATPARACRIYPASSAAR